MISGTYEKQPWEQESVKVEFANRLNSFPLAGYVIASAEVKVYDDAGTDVTTTMLEASSFSGTDVYATFKAGTDGKDYSARFRLTCTKSGSPDQKPEEDLTIRVRQRGRA